MYTFYYYPKCSTCQKAKKWLDAQNIPYTPILIHEQPPTPAELGEIWQNSHVPLKKLFNTSGMKYRELNLKTVLPSLSEAEQLELLSSDGMLIKRPLLVQKSTVLIGFKVDIWEKTLHS
ncbi:MAG: arsenate reductase family protein [Culicoidibacterales bacterium]